jgi:4-hydroxy-2-oxoheptanedioate aldolase
VRTSIVKKKLRRDEAALVVCLHYTDASIHEMTSLMGFDCIWLDLEHHGYSVETATQMMRAARVGSSDILARPAKGEFMRMSRLLEMGATGILYPRCDNAEEAAEVVRWAKFAPQGQRGADGANADMPYLMMPIGEYVRKANEETFVAIQVEDADGVARADEIAAVDGVDILFFGPGDFSILSGFPGQMDHPEIQRAMEHVAAAARRHGKHWGMPCFSPDHGRKLLDMGARFLAHGADIVLLKRALENIQAQFSPLGFHFGS